MSQQQFKKINNLDELFEKRMVVDENGKLTQKEVIKLSEEELENIYLSEEQALELCDRQGTPKAAAVKEWLMTVVLPTLKQQTKEKK